MNEFISKLTWVDYVALIALLRGMYVGYKSGLFQELLRVISYLMTLVITLIWYESYAQLLTLNTFLNLTTARVAAFCIVFLLAGLVTKIVRVVLVKLFKLGEGGTLSRFLGMVLGGARWIVLLSFFFMLVDASPLNQLREDMHQRSLIGPIVTPVAPTTLEFMAHLLPRLALELNKKAT